jgi:hypothetical protein
MATQITIAVGALSRNRQYSNDTKAQSTLLDFYASQNLGPDNASNGDKLLAVIDYLVKFMQANATKEHVEQAEAVAKEEADDIYGFE